MDLRWFSTHLKIKTLADIFRLLLGIVFFVSAVPKIINPIDFAINLSGYELFPQFMVPLISLFMPFLELVLGLFLISNVWSKTTVLLTIFLYISFIGILIYALIAGLEINCGCFSQDPGEVSSLGLRLVEDIIFLIAAMWIFAQTKK